MLESDSLRQNHLADTHERLYITALPIYRALFGGIRNLSQWRSVPRTLTAMAIYFTLWHYHLLLYSTLLFPMLWLLKMRDHPPAPQLLRHSMLTRGHQQLILKRHLAMSKGKVQLSTLSGQDQRATAASKWADEVAAMHEKAKNVALWRSPPATLRVFACLAMMFVAIVLADGSTLSHCFALCFGVWFFVLRPVWTKWPRLRVLPDLAGTLSGTPDDDECAMEAIRRRANAGKPVLENPIMLITLHDLEDDDMHNDKDGCELPQARWTLANQHTDADFLDYRCIYKSSEGYLIVQSHSLAFAPTDLSQKQTIAQLDRITSMHKIDTVDELISGDEEVEIETLNPLGLKGLQIGIKGRPVSSDVRSV